MGMSRQLPDLSIFPRAASGIDVSWMLVLRPLVRHHDGAFVILVPVGHLVSPVDAVRLVQLQLKQRDLFSLTSFL